MPSMVFSAIKWSMACCWNKGMTASMALPIPPMVTIQKNSIR